MDCESRRSPIARGSHRRSSRSGHVPGALLFVGAMKIPRAVHVGLPKTGTTSIQRVLEDDPRVCQVQSRMFNGKTWWEVPHEKPAEGEVVVESNENLITGGFGKVKFVEVLGRLARANPKCQIIVTIREQRKLHESMFRHQLGHGRFHGDFDGWLASDLGMDFLSTTMYGTLLKAVGGFFPRENLHFLLYEEFRDAPERFYEKFYRILGLPPPTARAQEVRLNIGHNQDEAYVYYRLNTLRLGRTSGSLVYRVEKRLKREASRVLARSVKAPPGYFKWPQGSRFDRMMNDFAENNAMLVDAGAVERAELEAAGYCLP